MTNSKNATNICAIVIGDDHYNGLGVIRSLGERGIPVYLLLFVGSRNNVISRSKYVIRYKIIKKDMHYLLNEVNCFSTEFEKVFVYPVSDFSALFCDKFYNLFHNNIIIPNAKGSLEQYENKFFISSIAKEYSIICPKHVVYDLEQKNDRLEWSLFPTIIKPLLSIEGHKSDIKIVNNSIELSSFLSFFKNHGYKRVLIEEYIDGDDSYMVEILGCSNGKGEVVFSHLIKKIREYPINNGSTSFAEIVNDLPNLDLEIIKSFISNLNFNGLFDLEFKYKHGFYYFIELNFRNGAPGHSLTNHGFNIPYTWLSLSLGKKVFITERNSKQIIMCELYDALHVLKGHVNLFVWIKDFFISDKLIWDWKDLKTSICYYYFYFLDIISSHLTMLKKK